MEASEVGVQIEGGILICHSLQDLELCAIEPTEPIKQPSLEYTRLLLGQIL